MTILIDENTRVIVQGITGNVGSAQSKFMLDYGTRIVAGVSPGKGGKTVHDIPVFDSVKGALAKHPADASIVFVPANGAEDAASEALESGLKLVVLITEHVPIHDAIRIKALAESMKARMLGPNTPGVIAPGKSKIGIMPGNLYMLGRVGIVARSATLSYEIAGNLTEAGIGQSTCVGIGGDFITGMNFVDVLKLFEEDRGTDAIVLVGEIGRTIEEQAASFINDHFSKPVVSYVAGRFVPPGKRMGHAGAIIERGRGSWKNKVSALKNAGVEVVDRPFQIVETLKKILEVDLL